MKKAFRIFAERLDLVRNWNYLFIRRLRKKTMLPRVVTPSTANNEGSGTLCRVIRTVNGLDATGDKASGSAPPSIVAVPK